MHIKTIITALVLGLAGLLVGCNNDVSIQQAAEQARQAANAAKVEEAKLTDAKLAAAEKETNAFGASVARQGKYTAAANCDVLPEGIRDLKAAKDFPAHVSTFFRRACVKQVVVMNAERIQASHQAKAQERQRLAKVAAKKAQAVAKAKAAEQKRLAQTKPQPKPAAKTGERRS